MTRTASTPRPSKPAPRVGRRCSSARSTPATPSPSTSRGLPVADGDLGRHLRLQQLVHAGAAGSEGVAAVALSYGLGAADRRPRRRSARRRGARSDPCRRADVPLQQPRRDARPAPRRRRLRGRSARSRTPRPAGSCWQGRLSASASSPRWARHSSCCPPFALAYLIAAPDLLRRRIMQTLAAGVAVVVGAGWWIAIVELWPASSRPVHRWVAPTTRILELAFGYNGLGRLFGGVGQRRGRRRGRCRHRRRGQRRLRRRDRSATAVHVGHGHRDLVAVAHRPGRPGGRALADPTQRPYRHLPRRPDPLRWVPGRHRARVLLHEGHHPPVLHGRPRSWHRRSHRHHRP